MNLILPNWPAPSNVSACTTLRDNNDLILAQIPEHVVWLQQVHGIEVVCVDDISGSSATADAAISFEPQNVCLVKTADCLPILICDQAGTQVAAIHAGWRGLAAGIIDSTCARLTADPAKCLVWLGPAIGPTAFEVGVDVIDGFRDYNWDKEILKNGFERKIDAESKWLGDLYYLARKNLERLGFLPQHIYGGEYCTFSEPEKFYSYRRSKDVGRMYTLIWIK